MGQEGSKLDGDGGDSGEFPALMPECSEERLAPGLVSKPAAKKAGPPKAKSWMLNSQTRVSTQTDVRASRVKRSSHTGSISGLPNPGQPPSSIESDLSQLKIGQIGPGRISCGNLENKQEETKKEFLDKLNSYVRRTPPKNINDLQPPKVPIMPEQYRAPEPQKRSWIAKLCKSKEETLNSIKEQLGKEKYYEPLTQEQVGDKVEKSLGSALDTFAGYQGTVHTMMSKGLSDDMLDNFLFDEESEKQLTTYEKWAVIRHAAEQVLQVYANRGNAQWIEQEQWTSPTIVDANAVSASVYANAVDSAITSGNVALLFIDDGRLVELGEQEVAPMLSTDLWQAIKELAPHKVPSSQRLERLSVAGRHLLHAAVSVEMWYGTAALQQLKVIVAIDCEQEFFLANELQQWGFFGLQADNLAILPLPRFHGFAQDQRTGRLAHVKGSARLMLGTGYAMFLLNSPAEAYTLTEEGNPQCLRGSVLDWLREQRASWLFTGHFSDVERLRPEALFDVDFLAAAMYCADRGGCNMAMEVVHGDAERDVRTYDSIVLGRAQEPGGNCNLRASAMRTVRSYQILQRQTKNPHGFYLSTHRYVYRVSALQKLLVDASAFHADVRLHGFYAYATFDLSDITTFKEANCACILGGGLKGPSMNDVVYGKPWLSYVASILEMQDKVNEFRQKAIDLVKYDKANFPSPTYSLSRLGGTFKERKAGFNVVLLLTPENVKLVKAAIKFARLFIRNIADRLYVVALVGGDARGSAAKALLDEVSDKELEFHGQLIKDSLSRDQGSGRVADLVRDYCDSVQAGVLVVTSLKLCGPGQDLGVLSGSVAFNLARNLIDFPLLIVKSNSSGRFLTNTPSAAGGPSNGRDPLTVMCHLDTTQVAPMVEAITQNMVPGQDLLYLAKTQAFERPGQLSMRSRRVFVQGRMAVAAALKVEERAYAAGPTVELPKAVDGENVDLLVVSAAAGMAISKEVEELLKGAKTSLYIYRNRDSLPPPAPTQNSLFTDITE